MQASGSGVNAILPGLMKTPMVEKSADLAQSYADGNVEKMWRARDRQVPMGLSGRLIVQRIRGRFLGKSTTSPAHRDFAIAEIRSVICLPTLRVQAREGLGGGARAAYNIAPGASQICTELLTSMGADSQTASPAAINRRCC